jgi:hypothetical protein
MVARKGAGFQRRYLHSGRIRGGVTQLPSDATAVIGCWTWVKRAFILPILMTLLSWHSELAHNLYVSFRAQLLIPDNHNNMLK